MVEDSRPSWENPMQFVLACVSYAVGLGNVWRFPYLCQMHGGGGFLIPYLIMLVVEGLPLFYLELAIGQHMRQGSIGAWSAINPYMGGVGIASVVVSIFLTIYYNVINAWAFWYLFHSFQGTLPWAECPLSSNLTTYVPECEKSSSTDYFWYRETLNISSSIEDHGGIQMGQALCLVLSWMVVYLCVLRGTEATGKVVYFTATFPYLVMIIYLIRGVTLHGALNGLKYMFTPKLSDLADPKAWIDAATQILFSLGLGCGSLIAFASYNHHNNNFEKQAIVVSLINSATSIFASLVTFSIYGFKATFNYESCLDRTQLLLINTFDLTEDSIKPDNLDDWISHLNASFPDKFATISSQIEGCDLESELDTAVEGTGLAFIVYSEAIKNMGLSQLWSVLYFSMLLMLGIGSMLGNVAAIITPLRDSAFLTRHFRKETLIGMMCLFCCLVGLSFTTRSGNYWFTIFNDYAATFSLLFIVLIEIITICYVYGLKKFEKDIELMIGHRPHWYWKITWSVVSPVLIIGLFIFYTADYIMGGTPTYQAWDSNLGKTVTKEYPPYAQAVIGLLLVTSMICVPLVALITFIKKKKEQAKESKIITTAT
ncbi:sodium- and chloride-dependent transporter XTRP3-like [Acipenser ruthenus]|uniref:sodium- and chloride-dependent transporter XTRP3-like n=1 Tax=Acipenser ruthenus TaxID=7906 RepID=UPI002741AAF1|nr:sodium- and chloride-dependent transporter XTRP3-like [Acipenser ruthenus]